MSFLCPICSETTFLFFEKKERIKKCLRLRTYYRCPFCYYIFLSPTQRLSREEEKKRYLEHNNNTKDPRYLKYLSYFYDEVFSHVRIDKGRASVLDFGCGPEKSMEALNSSIKSYDPFFFPQREPLYRKWDLILLSEVAEHFYFPLKDFKRLKALLSPKGVLAVRTEDFSDGKDFKNWHYRKDSTHVGFFHIKTFSYLSEKLQWTFKNPKPSVFIFFPKP